MISEISEIKLGNESIHSRGTATARHPNTVHLQPADSELT
jgi:hypothetical protein